VRLRKLDLVHFGGYHHIRSPNRPSTNAASTYSLQNGHPTMYDVSMSLKTWRMQVGIGARLNQIYYIPLISALTIDRRQLCVGHARICDHL